MKNFKFIISYDGSRYFGWERQPGRDTIQGKLEAVLTLMCGTDVQVIGAGRTDAGVHARAMAANAYMNTEKTPEEIRDYMNRYLPDDICVQEAKLAADRFHGADNDDCEDLDSREKISRPPIGAHQPAKMDP